MRGSTTARAIAAGILRGGGNTVFLLRDLFSTDEAAPMATPRTCEPGPGELDIVDVEGDKVHVLSSEIVIDTLTTPGYNRAGVKMVSAPALTSGVAVAAKFAGALENGTGGVGFGPLSAKFKFHGFYGNLYGVYVDASGVYHRISLTAPAVGSILAIIPRSKGMFYLVSGELQFAIEDELSSTYHVPQFASYSGNRKLGSLSLIDLPANGKTEFTRDFSEVTDSLSTPATGTKYECEVDHHQKITFTYEAGNYVRLLGGYVGGTAYCYRIRCQAAGACSIDERDGATDNYIYTENGVFTDGVTYQIDAVKEGTTLKLYINGVLKTTETLQFYLTTAKGNVDNSLATNDIELETHPYPALGPATSRTICPQAGDTQAAPDDCLVRLPAVTLPSAGSVVYSLRYTDDNNRLYIEADSSANLYLKQVVSGTPTTLVTGTMTDGEDLTLWVSGGDGRLYHAATLLTATSSITHLTGTGGGKCSSLGTGGWMSAAEIWPIDWTGKLPKELYQ